MQTRRVMPPNTPGESNTEAVHGPAYLEHVGDLEAARHWQPGEWALSAGEQAELAVMFDRVCAEAEQKRAEHRARIRRAARWLGVEVAEHRITISDAERRLEAVATACDADGPGRMFILPYREAVAIAESAFADSYRSARKRVK
jgi:hypothetical protein